MRRETNFNRGGGVIITTYITFNVLVNQVR